MQQHTMADTSDLAAAPEASTVLLKEKALGNATPAVSPKRKSIEELVNEIFKPEGRGRRVSRATRKRGVISTPVRAKNTSDDKDRAREGNSDPQQVKALPGPGQESAVETSVTRRTSAVTDAVNRKESSPQESFSTTKKSVGHKSADRTNTQRQKLKKSKVPVRFQERTSKGFSKTINAFDQEKSERAHTRPITRRSTGTHEAQAAATQKTVEASSKDARPRSINTTNSILSGKVDLHKINPERILRVLAHSNFNLPELDADWLKSVSSRDWTNVDLSEWSTIVQVMKHLEENSAAAPLDANSPANSSPHQTESLAKQLSQLVHEAVSHHTQVRGDQPQNWEEERDTNVIAKQSKDFTVVAQKIKEILAEADAETVDELYSVYVPAFQKHPSLEVDPEAYYESEVDTLSCCSDEISPEAEEAMERRAYEIQMPEIFEMLKLNAGHFTEYAMLDRSTMRAVAISNNLKSEKPALEKLMRVLVQLMEPSQDMSNVVRGARELLTPILKRFYVVKHLDFDAVYARTADDDYEGFVARPVLGFFIFLFYDKNSHPGVAVDVAGSLVDYVTFCVFNCLPEYEDGFQKNIAAVLDSDDEDCMLSRKEFHEKHNYKSEEIFGEKVSRDSDTKSSDNSSNSSSDADDEILC